MAPLSLLSMSDEWRTPVWLVDQLSATFGPFELDVAAAPWNHQAPKYFTAKDDALKRRWWGRCWMNPPYSRGNLRAFLPYAREQVISGRALSVTGVVPHSTADRWWKEVVRPEGPVLRAETRWGRMPHPFEDWRITVSRGLTVHVIPILKRVAFLHRASGRAEVVGWRSNARGSHVAFHLERTHLDATRLQQSQSPRREAR